MKLSRLQLRNALDTLLDLRKLRNHGPRPRLPFMERLLPSRIKARIGLLPEQLSGFRDLLKLGNLRVDVLRIGGEDFLLGFQLGHCRRQIGSRLGKPLLGIGIVAGVLDRAVHLLLGQRVPVVGVCRRRRIGIGLCAGIVGIRAGP